ncbi:MAG: hypothetical protein IID33_16050 [Planctomycetes bacterium]|nr:hypothetical protein [Planctomycetota bacterium]
MSPIRIERRTIEKLCCGCVAALSLCMAAGCQSTLARSGSPVAAPPPGNAALMQYIADLPLVTAEAAYRGVYLIAESKAFEGDYETLRDELVERGVVGSNWNHYSNTLMNRAGVAYMICKTCDIRRGVNWFLFDQGRYAWRELQHMGIGGSGTELGNLSGGEFLGILSRADKYLLEKQRRGGGDAAEDEPAELGDEPGAEGE